MRRVAWLAILALGLAPLLGRPVLAEQKEDTCPEGPAAVASYQPVEVLGGEARVAFTLAPGCSDVWVSLLSHRPSGTSRSQPLLDLATGRFSAGHVYRLSVGVIDDCTFRVSFVAGRPPTLGRDSARSGLIEAAMQDPNACSFGAAPVVVTPTPEPGPAEQDTEPGAQAEPPTTRPAPPAGDPTARRQRPAPVDPATGGPARPGALPEPPAVAGGSARAAPERSGPDRKDPLVPADSLGQVEHAAALADAGDVVVEPDQTPLFAGWNGTLLLAALTALTAGALLLRLTRRGGVRVR